jgi:hypothetical protein
MAAFATIKAGASESNAGFRKGNYATKPASRMAGLAAIAHVLLRAAERGMESRYRVHSQLEVHSASLKEELRVCVYYRSPFFGKPLMTKVVCANGV